MKTGTLYTIIYIYIYIQSTYMSTHKHAHNIHTIFCIYQYNPIEEVQLIYLLTLTDIDFQIFCFYGSLESNKFPTPGVMDGLCFL